jgi:predicted amidohydrolase
MRKIATLLVLALLSLPLPPAAQTSEASLAFTHVTVIDVAAADSRRALRPDQTVVITGSRITAIGKTSKLRVPAGAQVVDASGKFLIPGLWDMHAHALTDHRYGYAFPLLIANGVTGIREMGSNLPIEEVNKLRQDVLSGNPKYRTKDG